MQRSKRAIVAAAGAALAQFSLFTFNASAASFTWDGGGIDDNITTAANWVGDVAPSAPGDVIFFDGSTRLTPNVPGPQQYLGITFAPTASAFTIGGPATSTITFGAGTATAGTIVNNGTLAQTFSVPVAMFAGTINAAAGNLTFNGPVNIGNGGTVSANQVTLTGNFAINFNGGINSSIQAGSNGLQVGTPVSGGNDVASTFNGTLSISTANPGFAGQVFINGGAVRISNGQALGTGTITTALGSGGTGKGVLELMGDITVNNNVVTRARDVAAANISLRNISGNNTLSNVFTNTGGSTFSYESAGGNLTITNWNTSATGTGRFLNLSGAGNGLIQNWASPPSNTTLTVNKSGAGTWTLGSGMNSGTFISMSVTGGSLVLQNGLGARMIGNATISTGGTLVVQASGGVDGEIGNGTPPTTLAVNAGGVLDASSFTTYSLQVAQTLVAAGTIKAGTLAAFGDNAIHIGNTTAPAAATLSIQGNLSLSNVAAATNGGLHFDLGNDTTIGSGTNDLVSVQGDVQIDNSSGPINIYVNALTGSYATGTYRLIDFTSGNTLNASDFSLQGFAASRQSATLTTATNQLNLQVTGTAANLVWKGDGSGNTWDVNGTSNWLNGAAADKFFNGDNVTFNDSTANNVVNIGTVVLPGSITVSSTQDYTFTSGGSISAISLTKGGTGRLIIANTGNNTIAGAVTINSGTLQIGNGGGDGSLNAPTISNSANLVVDKSGTVTLGGLIQGTGQIVKRSGGTLTLSGANTYTGATVVEAGGIQITNSAALGDVVTGTTVNSGGQVFATVAVTTAEPFNLNGDGPVAGDGALRSGGNANSTFSGAISLAGNTTLKVDGGATMNLTNTVSGTNTTVTLNADGGGTGNITGPLTIGTAGIIKNGGGTWVLANPGNVYGAAPTINAGVLQYGNGTVTGDAPLPTGTVNLPGGTIAFNNTGSYAVSNAFTGNGGIAVGPGGGTVTLTGDLSGFTGVLATLNGGAATPNSMLVVPVATNATSVVITDINLLGNGQGIVRITNSNAIANGASLAIQASQATGTGRLEVGNGVTLNFGSIALNPRNNLTATILATDGNNTINGPMSIATGGSLTTLAASAGASLTVNGSIAGVATLGSNRNLRLAGAGVGTFNGTIANNGDPTPRGVNIIKDDTGTWTMVGDNNSNGTYLINAGTLIVPKFVNGLVITGGTGKVSVKGTPNSASGTSVIPSPLTIATGGVLDLTNNSMVIDYNDPVGTQVTDVRDHLRNGRLTTSSATATTRLGYGDNEVLNKTSFGGVSVDTSSILIKYTYAGDADLDGDADGVDIGTWATNFTGELGGTGSMVWTQGDWDYDGDVDGVDAGLWAQAFTGELGGAGLGSLVVDDPNIAPGAAAILRGMGITVVPEPMALGLFGALGAMMLPRRARRRVR
ncbi:MAG TPA: autotransporter-associated beta strand repeat-containing protein [Tepidisphaeraceae bacterium]